MFEEINICEPQQPGPVHPERIQSFGGPARILEIALEPGLPLINAVSKHLVDANIQGAGIVFKDLCLRPMHYVKPTYSRTPEHVAFYSDTHISSEEVDIPYATATYGKRDGVPFMHCHALWEDNGQTRGGHVLAPDSIVSHPSSAMVYCTDCVSLDSAFDKETNFTLFQPACESAIECGVQEEECVVATIRPNVDLIGGIETICEKHRIAHAKIRSGIGSTVGAHFEDGRYVRAIPTELVALQGDVSIGAQGEYCVDIEFALIDAHGDIHKGRLAKRLNPVLICFELIITAEKVE